MYKNFKSEFKGDYLQSLSWGAAKAYKVPEHVTFMDQLEEDEPDAKKWLERESLNCWARSHFDLTSKCDAITNNFSESFNNWIPKIRDKPLIQLVDKYNLAVMGLLHQRKELLCEMPDNELIPAVRDVIERLEKKHTRYKVKPEDVVNLHHSRDIQDNKRTCPLGKDQTSKKSRKADEANEAKDIELEVGNAENNEGEWAEEVVAEVENLQNDVPRARRGGRAGGRRGVGQHVNLQPVINVLEAEPEVENLQVPKVKRGGRAGSRRGVGQHVNLQPVIDVPEAEAEPKPEVENLQVLKARRGGRIGIAEATNVRRYGTRSGIGKGGGRGLGWWLGEDL
ncbi:hypothetical protein IFM89_029019 [Coptis chinensis]|uniref:Uncharacterized protein n=1 Tax=Coptis chinensis TaxID=261450 RepID=A0A835IIC1_9MAGN|nr:hypothetical protein IFM89_029019 [Coptis chinensis]